MIGRTLWHQAQPIWLTLFKPFEHTIDEGLQLQTIPVIISKRIHNPLTNCLPNIYKIF